MEGAFLAWSPLCILGLVVGGACFHIARPRRHQVQEQSVVAWRICDGAPPQNLWTSDRRSCGAAFRSLRVPVSLFNLSMPQWCGNVC